MGRLATDSTATYDACQSTARRSERDRKALNGTEHKDYRAGPRAAGSEKSLGWRRNPFG